MTNVPFNDLSRQWTSLGDRLEEAVNRVLSSGWYLLGPETQAFETEFAELCGSEGCVAVANGTDALEIALRSVGCGRDDEVIVTANAGMYATTACLAIGSVPVFADVIPETLLISPDSAASLVTARTRAVVATHLYGNVVDVEKIRSRLPAGVAIVEDCAQAHGATIRGLRVGSLGDAGTFSFYPTKNLGALGDAGAIVSRSFAVLTKASRLRQYGWTQRYHATEVGGRNSRIDEVQAACLRALLPELPEWNDRRRRIAATYRHSLGERLQFITPTEESNPVAHLCVARVAERDKLIDELAGDGISCGVHFPVADHQQAALEGVVHRHGDLRETELACAEVISLPCYPFLRDDELETVIEAVRSHT